MGTFNTVKTPLTCPHCGCVEIFAVQFKYADTYQNHYNIGDKLSWADDPSQFCFPRLYQGPLIGTPGNKLVVVDAIAEDCPHCGAEGDDCEVWLQEDVITEVRLTSHKYDEFFRQESYHVVSAK